MQQRLDLAHEYMTLRLLSRSDNVVLQAFEVDNQAWFDSHLPSREAEFYSEKGVKQHIEECLAEYHRKTMLPMVVAATNGEIVGRVNLHNINTVSGVAYLGYRVSEHFAGQGITQQAVQKLMLMIEPMQLKTLIALVSVKNCASQKILLNQGFVEVARHPHFAEVQGDSVECIELHKSLV